ncbi:MAG: FdtA/QdtA family cupin domain-containing protein [Balneola sp.]
MKNSVHDATVLKLPKIHNIAGNITAIGNSDDIIPFDINRIYYLYDIPGGEERGAHAHKELQQLIIAGSGSFDITLDDGKTRRTFHLSQPYFGLYMPSGLWRELHNFSSGAICLVLASHIYNEKDYIRDYKEFQKFRNEQ